MAGRIEVTMESTYRGDLSKRLREDKQKLDAFQKWLDRSPLRVPVKLDLSGVKAQAAAMREAILFDPRLPTFRSRPSPKRKLLSFSVASTAGVRWSGTLWGRLLSRDAWLPFGGTCFRVAEGHLRPRP